MAIFDSDSLVDISVTLSVQCELCTVQSLYYKRRWRMQRLSLGNTMCIAYIVRAHKCASRLQSIFALIQKYQITSFGLLNYLFVIVPFLVID